MNPTRSAKAAYVAAFLFGALIAFLITRPLRAADTFRLDRIGIVQFSALGSDRLRLRTGVLDLQGRIQWRFPTEMARPANTPDWALDRPLINVNAWLAYYGLGSGATQGFELQLGAVSIPIGTDTYKAIGVNPDFPFHDGALINLSTRATLVNGSDEIIAGFVIENRPRAVLVRVIGPGLTRFGVTNAATDPFLAVKQNGQTLHANDNWSSHPDADLVARVSTRAGAFPLDHGSRDAARVLILPPGVYTLHATSANVASGGGNVLLEIYQLTADDNYDSESQ